MISLDPHENSLSHVHYTYDNSHFRMEEIEVHSNVILEYQHRAGPNQIWGSDQEIYKTIEMYDSAISFWKA